MGNSSKVKRQRGHADKIRNIMVVDASDADRIRLRQIENDALRAMISQGISPDSIQIAERCIASAIHATAVVFGYSVATPPAEAINGQN